MTVRRPDSALFLLPLLVFVVAVFSRDINRDEGQYASAVELMRTGLPYRDFVYLQTPLQPLLLAPLGWFGGLWLLLDLRLVNALAAALGVRCVFHAVRAAGGDTRRAILAAAMLIGCEPLIFGAAVARNDALPMLCEAGGLWMLVSALPAATPNAMRLCLAGLAFAAAASLKISYGFAAAVAGLAIVSDFRRIGARGVLAFCAGSAIGLAPTAILAAIAPQGFLFGVLHYSAAAPRQWCDVNHCTAFSLAMRLRQTLRFLIEGPALFALLLVLWHATMRGVARRTWFVEAMIVAGLVAGWLPEPALKQYLIPLLVPLFVRIGAGVFPLSSRPWTIILGLSSTVGIAHTAYLARNLVTTGSPILAALRDDRWIAGRLKAGAIAGPIVALSPERVAGAATLDPRFAPGPFVFRSTGLLPLDQEARLHILTWRRMDSAFAQSPPRAIVVGGERVPEPVIPDGLDAIPERWAQAHHYRSQVSPSGRLTLYTAP